MSLVRASIGTYDTVLESSPDSLFGGGSNNNSRFGEGAPRSASLKEEAATRLERTAEYVINSTISQDITGGMEKNQNESLAALAAKLVKSHEGPFKRQERNLGQKSSNLSQDIRLLPREPRPHQNSPGAMSKSYQTPQKIQGNSLLWMGQDFFGASGNPQAHANFQPPQHLSMTTYNQPSERYEYGMKIPSDCSSSRFVLDEDGSDDNGNDNEWATTNKELPMNRGGISTMPSNSLSIDNNDEEQIMVGLSSNIMELHEKASLATATELSDMQNVLLSLNVDQKKHMSSSGLDPILYYFTYLKGDAPKHNQMDIPKKSDHQDTAHENIGTGLEEPHEDVPIRSEGSTISERLHALQASIPEREQLRLLEESRARESPLANIETQSPSHHSYKPPEIHSSLKDRGDSLPYTKPSSRRLSNPTANMKSKVSHKINLRFLTTISFNKWFMIEP
jgi:hypothetical protein